MKLNSIIALAKKLLNATRQVASGPNTYKSQFARVVEGTFRRDYLTLFTMVYLAEYSQPEMRIAFGNSCMDLCRRVLEDFISLEYMLFKGKESQTQKFFDYKAVEAKHDIDFLEAIGASIDQVLKITVDKDYDRVKRQFLDTSSRTRKRAWDDLTEFLRSHGKLDEETEHEIEEEFRRRYPDMSEQTRKAWAGLDTEGMIEALVNDGVINAQEQGILIQTYIQGNRKNHFSPTDIHDFLFDQLYRTTSESDLKLSLIATTTAVTRIARIFMDESDIQEATKQAIDEIWQTIFTAHLSKDE